MGVGAHAGEVIVPALIKCKRQTKAFGPLWQADMFKAKLGAARDFSQRPFDGAGRVAHRFDGEGIL
jgi:hypothetical protein